MSCAVAADKDKSQAALLLKKQLKQLNKQPIEGFSAGLVNDDNIYNWQFCILGPSDTL
jgi:ubiquitin-conjugating enzyme E2 G1